MTESNIIERLRSCVCETGAYSAVINDAIDAITGLHQQLHTAQGAARADALRAIALSKENAQTSDKWREAFARSANLAVDNWERDVSPKIAGIRMDRIINMLLERATGAEAALREVVSQCHNLPRTATADRIESIASAALRKDG